MKPGDMDISNAPCALPTPSPARGEKLLAGFVEPVDEAQAVFRQALDALAQPGRIHGVVGRHEVPIGMGHAMTALLLTLADSDTPLWLPAGVDAAVHHYLRFHCGCPLLDAPECAALVAAPKGFAVPPLAQLAQGLPAYPDRSATLLLEVSALRAGEGVRLSGPGIATHRRLAVDGLPADFWLEWRCNQQRFPLGVDVFLTCADQLCGLPRTTLMEY